MTNSNDFSIIKAVLNKYFSFIREQGDYAYGAMTEKIPKVMLDKDKEPDDEGYSFWLPIESTVTEKEISELEKLFRHQLPASFKYFLKQKHFIELYPEQNVSFFSLLPHDLVKTYKKIIDTYYWTLLDTNYLPFANYGDWGVLCFNANIMSSTYDYEIVILDHDDEYQNREFYATNFLSMFDQFDKQLDQTITQIRDHKKNNA